MKEKLELKHLAPYLPYGLKFQSSMDKPFEEYGRQPTWTFDGMTKLFGDYCLNTLEYPDAYPIQLVKPILRPLSYLTKEIEVNGKKFVPIDYFLGDDVDLILNAIQIKDLSYLPYNLIQKLFEWNFDVFGLIEKGLAIDINTLNL